MNYLKITWWNDYDLGDILYQDGYKNILYLDTEVEKPEYNTTIESDLNGDNREITKFRKEEKVYRFTLWGQEDLTDAFAFMQIHDNIEVTLQSGDIIQVAKHGLRADITWEEIGCLAKIQVSFSENYTIAGNCNQNMDEGCLCDDPGTIIGIREYTDLSSLGPNPLDYAIGYTVEDIADKKYTASLYQYDGGWIQLANPDQYACFTNSEDSTVWIFDGQFWQLYPGYIISLSQPDLGVNDILVTGEILPGAFCSIYVLLMMGWTNFGDYTKDEIETGVTVSVPEDGSKDFKLKVWNHSCDYDYTEIETIVII